MISSMDPLINAVPRHSQDDVEFADDEVSSLGGVSIHTARLYSDVSEEEFSDCNEDFLEEVNNLEREYFESLHVKNVEANANYRDTPVIRGEKILSAFEKENFHQYNVTPDRPCSAFFKTDSYMPAAEIFEALKKDGFRSEYYRCLQRKPNGDIFLTFRTGELRDAFLSRSSLVTRRRSFAPNDSERPLTYLTVYDAPYELPDAAIVHRLSPYCEVVWYRRGTYKNRGGVLNGLRHFRVRVNYAIPSYLRFGKFQLRLLHEGQIPTCRKCNRTGHKAAECRKKICFNCDGLGHMSKECIRPMYCCICKSGQHLARNCHFSWHREKEPEKDHQESKPEFCDPTETVPDGSPFPAPGELLHMRADDPPLENPEDIPAENPPEGDPGKNPEQCPNHVDGEPKRPIVIDPESVLAESEEQPTIN